MKTAAFDVMLNGVRLTTVFRESFKSAAQVQRELVTRQHYDEAIVVEKLG